MHILLVDDEQVIHESLQKVLGREGFLVHSFFSASAALDHLSEEACDLVITDLMMPEMDGIEFLEQLRRTRQGVPAIMITGYPTIRTALQALRSGASDYIPKPFTRKELLAPVRRLIRRQAADHDDPASPSPDTIQGSDVEGQSTAVADRMVWPLLPGDSFSLPEHSWFLYHQDGTVSVGIQDSCLRSVGSPARISLPGVDELVEQGYPAIHLTTDEQEEHRIFFPISGRVMNQNTDAMLHPSDITGSTPLVTVLPSDLQDELQFLQKVVPSNPLHGAPSNQIRH